MTPAVSCSEAFVPDQAQRMMPDDLRALTPLIYAHVTPYGTFRGKMADVPPPSISGLLKVAPF